MANEIDCGTLFHNIYPEDKGIEDKTYTKIFSLVLIFPYSIMSHIFDFMFWTTPMGNITRYVNDWVAL